MCAWRLLLLLVVVACAVAVESVAVHRSPMPKHEDALARVRAHVEAHGRDTFREPAGKLRFPYLVPAGPYNQLWDWDSVFMGVGLLDYGSAPYLLGSMKNFLDHTDDQGRVKGCLTPEGASKTLFHVKPVVIQGAWLACRRVAGACADMEAFLPQMRALLAYWDRERLHAPTGLYVWFDVMESGADNLPVAMPDDKLTLSAADVMTFLIREHEALVLFLRQWARSQPEKADEYTQLAAEHTLRARAMRDAMDAHLWQPQLGRYTAFHTKQGSHVDNRVFLMAFPLFARASTPAQAAAALEQMERPDMLSPFGVRSTSSDDAAFNNENIIVPYSNWRGPVWIVSNVLLAYGAREYGRADLAQAISKRIVATLAADLDTTDTWHECYHSEKGVGLAAPGFLSWNVLAATLPAHLASGTNPFALAE